MKTKTIIIITALTCSIMLFADNAFADIPAPPVNQSLGMPDSILNNLVEAECRACHDDPEIVGGPSNSDRHHLLYGSALIKGECSVNGIIGDNETCITNADCNPDICESYGNACTDDTDCRVNLGETCGEVCVGETAASNPLENTDVYACLSCHDQSTVGGVTNFLVQRDCLACHYQVPGEGSVHHLTATAQGTNSPLGDPARGDCTPCHGTLVDDYGDDAIIPTYEPSMVTPSVNYGDGLPLNSEGNGSGACNYCHTSGTNSTEPGTDNATGILVYNNGTTHHTSGVFRTRTGAINTNNCSLCHGTGMDILNIRNCEQCHGMESLHNIQADSTAPDNIGTIVVGQEDYGFGHIGADNPGAGSDCWGCHGFGMSAAPAAGPITPYISYSTKELIIAGTDTGIIVVGSSFTNSSGTTEFVSTFNLTSKDGTVVELTPKWIFAAISKINIPGTTVPGNYLLTAVKDNGAAISNPLPISIKAPVIIGSQIISSSCGDCTGKLTVTGSGFGDQPPAGAEIYINVMQNSVPLNITTWSDTLITTTGAACDGSEITVNGLFGSATK
jgi:hypothetical protein